MKPHPDRLAPTLAQRDLLSAEALVGPFAAPGRGSADARVDLKQLAFAARAALARHATEPARARLRGLEGPDLWAGTVQDGTARGFAVALEEVIALCGEAAAPAEPNEDRAPEPAGADGLEPLEAAVFTGRDLRRKRDVLVASAGARVRFSRKGGLLLVDRARDVHVEDFLVFEDRTDLGTLDAFAAPEGERPRLFSPAFLTPVRLEQGRERDELVLEGRLGRRARGYPCRIAIEGRKDRDWIRLSLRVENRFADHRLRLRLRGVPPALTVAHRGTPGWEAVDTPAGGFVAATIVRACGWLQVGDRRVPVPAAQCPGWIGHDLALGGAAVPPGYQAADRSGEDPTTRGFEEGSGSRIPGR